MASWVNIKDPDPLHLVTVHQLTKGRIDAVSDPAEESAALRPGVVSSTAEGRLKLDRVLLQLFLEEGRPVVAVPHQQAGSLLGQCWDQRRFMDIGWGDSKSGDAPRPSPPDVDSEAVEGLTGQAIMAIGSLSFEPSTPVSSGELADGQGEAIHQSKSGVVLGQVQEFLPHVLLDLPEVSRLAHEGSPMYLYQPREEVPIMLTKVPEKGLVLTVPDTLLLLP